MAEILDRDEQVVWWHRNPVRQSNSVSLYAWAEGQGFFPDFVVSIKDRKIGNGIALLEIKGPHIQAYDKKKAAATHTKYGKVYVVGRDNDKGPFYFLRFHDESLVKDGQFDTSRMKWE